MSVYFALAPNGLIKIGYSQNPLARVKALRGETSAPLKLLAVIAGDEAEERRTHMRFGEYYFQGEWFFYKGKLRHFVRRQPLPPQPSYTPHGNHPCMSAEYVRLMAARVKRERGWTIKRAREYVIKCGPPGKIRVTKMGGAS